MYDLVADVARYPEFLPWCAAARVRGVTPEGQSQVMEADLVISFKVFRERCGRQRKNVVKYFSASVHGSTRVETET